MKTNSFVTFISSSNADWSRSRHHMRCLHLPPVPAAKPTMMDTTTLPAFISPINLPNPRRKYRYYHLYATSDENDGCDEVDKSVEMVEAFSHLETLTTEDWDDDSNTKEQIDYSSVLKYSRTDDTPALNFGKSTEEEVRYYLEMQQQLEGTAITEIDDGKLSVDERDSDVDYGLVPDAAEFPWTSINPILRLRGPVATGYGRGGKQLGVPTANVSA